MDRIDIEFEILSLFDLIIIGLIQTRANLKVIIMVSGARSIR